MCGHNAWVDECRGREHSAGRRITAIRTTAGRSRNGGARVRQFGDRTAPRISFLTLQPDESRFPQRISDPIVGFTGEFVFSRVCALTIPPTSVGTGGTS